MLTTANGHENYFYLFLTATPGSLAGFLTCIMTSPAMLPYPSVSEETTSDTDQLQSLSLQLDEF